MILVTKREKDAISERYSRVFFTRTMKQDSKRHHYYMEEAPGAMRMLRKLRYGEDYEEKKGSVNNRARKTNKRNASRTPQTNRLWQAR